MERETVVAWQEANQRYLMASVARLRARLERHMGDEPAADDYTGAEELALIAAGMDAPPALDTVSDAFGLSPFEREVLLLCAAIELDSTFSSLVATVHGDVRRPQPTFGLALAALPGAHWSALTPVSALRRWRLVEVGSAESLTSSPLRIDERLLHFLAGAAYLDDRLHGLLEPLAAQASIAPAHESVAERVVELWDRAAPRDWPAIQLCGPEPADIEAVTAEAATLRRLMLLRLRAADVPASAAEQEALARLCEREAALGAAAILLDLGDVSPEATSNAAALIDRLHLPLLVATREPVRGCRRSLITLDVEAPPAIEQRLLWREALDEDSAAVSGVVDDLVSQFRLSSRAMVSAAQSSLSHASSDDHRGYAERLWDACRVQARPALDNLAQRITSGAEWGDLVLPEAQLATLHDIAANVRQRGRVYETWGFAGKGGRGLGISALFAGASGTGKTLAGEVVANELQLDLYRIDLSQVVSKYIGETEKNLRRVFDAAEAGGAMLLFDEADALFGKRTEVKDSHDRYANIEVSYLLQRMEAYRGLAILTTNLKSALDTAFLRRLRFVVQFPFPEARQRALIWRKVFPPETPIQDLDYERLARLSLSGGNIRNIALHAAFLAADANSPVGMKHLLAGARAEFAKLERPLNEADVEGWL
jgi:hypothetical protein